MALLSLSVYSVPMKYFLIAITSIASLIFLADVLSLDYARLTEYGQGYLTGKIILLLASIAATVYLAMKIMRQRREVR